MAIVLHQGPRHRRHHHADIDGATLGFPLPLAICQWTIFLDHRAYIITAAARPLLTARRKKRGIASGYQCQRHHWPHHLEVAVNFD